MSSKTTKIEFGINEETTWPMTLDLDRLIETRALVEANSGGGKSYAIRKLIEEMHGKVQILIIDVEGEFQTLREKFDFLLVAKGGDIPASTQTAEVLAKRLLELEVSAIIDIYEMSAQDRKHFVRLFLDALINAPKELWHPVVVFIDEAQTFCPETGQSEAAESVISLMTRGRKRGQCGILCTQRLSNLNKNASAEAINKLIGRTGQDIDMKRAAYELGFDKKRMLTLRDLEPGEFFVFGPALSKVVVKVKIGQVATTHPKVGARLSLGITPPTDRIRKLLEAELQDIPQIAEKESNEKAELQRRNRDLTVENSRLKTQISTGPNPEQLRKVEADAFERGRMAGNREVGSQVKSMEFAVEKVKARVGPLAGFANQAKLELDAVSIQNLPKTIDSVKRSLDYLVKETAGIAGVEIPKVEVPLVAATTRVVPVVKAAPVPRTQTLDAEIKADTSDFGRCERAILKFLAMRQGKDFSRAQVGALTNYSPTSGGFGNALSSLRTAGLINSTGGKNGRISLVADRLGDVISILGDEYSAPERTSLETFLTKLSLCPRKIYEVLLKNPTTVFTREELAAQTEYSATSGGFGNGISELCTLGLAERVSGGIQLNHELLEIPHAAG